MIPLARYISFDSIFIIILRIFTGVAQGFMYPACLPIIAKWAPSIERGKLTSFLAAGSSLGIIFATLITGPICQKGYWEINFIILGISDATFFCFCKLISNFYKKYVNRLYLDANLDIFWCK